MDHLHFFKRIFGEFFCRARGGIALLPGDILYLLIEQQVPQQIINSQLVTAWVQMRFNQQVSTAYPPLSNG